MARPKGPTTKLVTARFSEHDQAALRFVADELRIDQSSTLRFLIHEKRRELELAIERRRRIVDAQQASPSAPSS